MKGVANPYMERHAPLRRGKWTTEEEAFANEIIESFKRGVIEHVDEGETLRSVLARKLCCAPMRISKKFPGSLVGKMAFIKQDQPQEIVAHHRNKLKKMAAAHEKTIQGFDAGSKSVSKPAPIGIMNPTPVGNPMNMHMPMSGSKPSVPFLPVLPGNSAQAPTAGFMPAANFPPVMAVFIPFHPGMKITPATGPNGPAVYQRTTGVKRSRMVEPDTPDQFAAMDTAVASVRKPATVSFDEDWPLVNDSEDLKQMRPRKRRGEREIDHVPANDDELLEVSDGSEDTFEESLFELLDDDLAKSSDDNDFLLSGSWLDNDPPAPS